MTGILFDLDGTLLDTLGDLTASVNHTLRLFGLPERKTEEIRRFVGDGAAKLMERSLPGLPSDPPLAQALAEYQRHYNIHALDRTAPYPGITEMLDAVRQYPIGIVSNKPDRSTKSLCEQFFPGIYALGQREGTPKKPAPDMLQQAMKDLGMDRCIYVGDSEVDIATAHNARIPCISVTWGFRNQDVLQQAGGRYFCHHPAELFTILDEVLYGK